MTTTIETTEWLPGDVARREANVSYHQLLRLAVIGHIRTRVLAGERIRYCREDCRALRSN
jgi:hypothetical protein